MSSTLESLTAAQREAVTHVDGPLLILAGPGSGKTRVVTHRIAHMIERGVPASQILALTFTNKAADEMRQRLARLAPGQSIWMGTFHRFGAYLLRRHAERIGLRENFSIGDVDDSRKILKAACTEARVDLELATPESIAQAISWAKNNLITADEYQARSGSVVGALAARVYPTYQKRLLRANMVDFDDLLLHVAMLLRDNPELRQSLDRRYRYVMVDEYQDTNLAQYAIVRSLSIDHPNLAVTGDPDQSIYGWRGANLSNILEFERDFPEVKVVRLEQNYRSTQRILRVADALISHNVRRKAKELFTENAEGKPVRLVEFPTQQDEADQIAGRIATEVRAGRRTLGDFAIFYRVNSLSRSLERSLRDQGLAYQIVHGVEFYQRKEVKDLVAYLQLVNNPANDAALLRIINTPARSIGATTVERLQQFASDRGLPLIEAARHSGLVPGLKARAALATAKFVTLLDRLRELATAPVHQILERLLDETGYRQTLEKSEAEEDQERLANIQEFLTDAAEFDQQHPHEPPLEPFLERTALVNDTDDLNSDAERVTLMTLHAAKGLEFPVVFLVGVEQGLLPHERSREDEAQLEEERRLLFVGITRAEEELQLSYCQYRMTHGTTRPVVPSSFLMELPRQEMDVVGAARSAQRLDFEFAGDWTDDELPSRQLRDRPDQVGASDAKFDAKLSEDFAEEFGEGPDDAAHFASPADQDYDESTPRRLGGGHRPSSDRGAKPIRGLSAGPRGAASSATANPLAALAGKLRTASELASGGAAPGGSSVSPDLFRLGMSVAHPQYGLGRILELVGSGPKRQATVRFDDGAERKFRLAFSPLSPHDD